MKYFSNIPATVEELKKQFRALCIKLHPDKGGNAEEFKAMLNEYETILKGFGAYNKAEREEVASLRRGCLVVSFGSCMYERHYICLSVTRSNGRVTAELVEIMSAEKAAGEWLADETSSAEVETSAHARASWVRPLSEKFGIGYYWDNIENKTFSEAEILEAEKIAKAYEAKAEARKAELMEQEAREEAKRLEKERAIIAEWSNILEELPSVPTWDTEANGYTWKPENHEKYAAFRKAEQKAEAQRKAAFKRNIKAVFAHFFPGVKVNVKDTAKAWCESSSIEWIDGPTTEEVEALEIWDYFLGWYFESDPYADYGGRSSKHSFNEWRQKFGQFSDDSIKFTRTLSEKHAAKVAEVLDAYEFAPKDEAGRVTRETGSRLFTWAELESIADAFHIEGEGREDFRRSCRNRDEGTNADGYSLMRVYRQTLEEYANNHMKVTTEKETPKQEAEPEATAETADNSAAPAEGLTLEHVGGVWFVSGSPRCTMANRKSIKSHGGTWNKEAKRWEAVTDEDAQKLREWFGVADDQSEPQSEPVSAEAAALVADMVAQFAELVALIAEAKSEAQKVQRFEGQPIAAHTLNGWAERAEAVRGKASQLARLFAEVCAALAGLSCADREKFDRFGRILWDIANDEQTAEALTAPTVAQVVKTATERQGKSLGDILKGFAA